MPYTPKTPLLKLAYAVSGAGAVRNEERSGVYTTAAEQAGRLLAKVASKDQEKQASASRIGAAVTGATLKALVTPLRNKYVRGALGAGAVAYGGLRGAQGISALARAGDTGRRRVLVPAHQTPTKMQF